MSLNPPDPRSLEGRLRAHALKFPEATEDFPWGERAIKVRGKVFLFLSAQGGGVSFSVKLPSSAAEALELPNAEPTHYGLGKHGWVTFTVDANRTAPLEAFTAWIEESYRRWRRSGWSQGSTAERGPRGRNRPRPPTPSP